jgi:hypothetical protein
MYYIMIGFLSLLAVAGSAIDTGDSAAIEAKRPNTGAADAKVTAMAYTGFYDSLSLSLDTASVISNDVAAYDSTIPVVGDTMDGEIVWQVKQGGVSWWEKAGCNKDWTCTSWIRPMDGALLAVHLTPPQSTRTSGRFRPGLYYLGEFKNAKYTIEGIPDTKPIISLQRMLRGPAMATRCKAREVVAWYLILSRYNIKSKPCWCIVDYGVPLRKIGGSDKDYPDTALMLTDYLHIYDAMTGNLLSIQTVK